MSEPEKIDTIYRIKENSKAYALIVATAITFIALMFVSTAITVYFLNQSIDPNVVATVDQLSQHHLATSAWQLISAAIIAVNGIISVFAYYQFRKWLRVHNVNLASKEKFKVKIWPILGMGFVIALAFGVLGGLIAVTNTTLHGLDPVSIYNALKSGSIYGILSVLIFLPIAGIIIVYLGPKTYHYLEAWEERHKFPDLPDHLGKNKDQTNPN